MYSYCRQGVMFCLADIVKNHTLLDAEIHRISPRCRKQLRIEFLALEDTIQMDPEFTKVCKRDSRDHCTHVKRGPGEVRSN